MCLLCFAVLAVVGVVATASSFGVNAEDVTSFKCPVTPPVSAQGNPHTTQPPPPASGCYVVPLCAENQPHDRDGKCDGNAGGGNDVGTP